MKSRLKAFGSKNDDEMQAVTSIYMVWMCGTYKGHSHGRAYFLGRAIWLMARGAHRSPSPHSKDLYWKPYLQITKSVLLRFIRWWRFILKVVHVNAIFEAIVVPRLESIPILQILKYNRCFWWRLLKHRVLIQIRRVACPFKSFLNALGRL